MSRDLRQQALNSILRSILLSPQSISIILLTLAFVVFDVGFLGMTPLLWLLFGLGAEAFYFFAVLSDDDATSAVVNRMLSRQYDTRNIQNPRARHQFNQALEYFNNMKAFARQQGGALREQLASTVSEMEEWVEQMYRLARRIDLFEENKLIARDRQRVPDELARLQRRYEMETDENIRQELHQAVQIKETQLENLRALENSVRRAELQLENTLSALGTVYTQMQVMDNKDVDSGHSRRLRQDIHDEILSLRDTIEAIDDVQASRLYATSS